MDVRVSAWPDRLDRTPAGDSPRSLVCSFHGERREEGCSKTINTTQSAPRQPQGE